MTAPNFPRGLWNGTIVHFAYLRNRADRFDMVASSLSRIPRWGGLQTGVINVAAHSYLVYKLVKDTFCSYKGELSKEDRELLYSALMHEVEEAFGVGDITTEVKAYIFHNCKDNLNRYKKDLQKQFNLTKVDDERIKTCDTIVALAESLHLLNNPEDIFLLYTSGKANLKTFIAQHSRTIEELSEHIDTHGYLYRSESVSKKLFLGALRELNWGENTLTI